jgi:hypothetical protein
MKSSFGILAFAAIALAGYGGCQLGEFLDKHERVPHEIANKCAYYDMDTGHFTWGPRPVSIMMPDDPFTETRKLPAPKPPGRKPAGTP